MLEEGKDYKFENSELQIYDKGKWLAISINGYKQERIIAAGANGITILAYHEILKREVVIKVWKPRTDNMEQYEAQFKAEIQKIATLDHPSITRIYDGQKMENGYCFAVMEYINGETFKDWKLKYNSITNIHERNIYKNLINALLAYQQHGIVHGDIHGGNILISKNHEIHIIDFGTSYPNKKKKSIQRELFLEFTTLVNVLKKEDFYKSDHFIIHPNYYLKKLVVNKKYRRVIRLNPLLLTDTLMSYAIIIGALKSERIHNLDGIKALAFAISNSAYLNLERIISDILELKIIDNENLFFRILISHIDAAVFSDYQEGMPSFYSEDILGVFSLEAYLEWYRNFSHKIKVDYEDKEIHDLYGSYDSDKIKSIIDDPNNTAFDIYNNNRPYLLLIRSILYHSIKRAESDRLFLCRYYMNSSIKEKILKGIFLDNKQDKYPQIDFDSVFCYFNTIHTGLNDAFEDLV